MASDTKGEKERENGRYRDRPKKEKPSGLQSALQIVQRCGTGSRTIQWTVLLRRLGWQRFVTGRATGSANFQLSYSSLVSDLLDSRLRIRHSVRNSLLVTVMIDVHLSYLVC